MCQMQPFLSPTWQTVHLLKDRRGIGWRAETKFGSSRGRLEGERRTDTLRRAKREARGTG